MTQKISEIDIKLLEKHDKQILEHIINKLDILINLINDREFLLLYLNPKRGYDRHNVIFEKLLYYRIKNNNSEIKSIIENGDHYEKYHLLQHDEFEKFENKIKEAYLRALRRYE